MSLYRGKGFPLHFVYLGLPYKIYNYFLKQTIVFFDKFNVNGKCRLYVHTTMISFQLDGVSGLGMFLSSSQAHPSSLTIDW